MKELRNVRGRTFVEARVFSSTRNGGRSGGGGCGVRDCSLSGAPPPGLPLKGEEKGSFLITLCSPLPEARR